MDWKEHIASEKHIWTDASRSPSAYEDLDLDAVGVYDHKMGPVVGARLFKH